MRLEVVAASASLFVVMLLVVPAASAVTIPGEPRFHNFVSPPGVGDDAGEPTFGVNETTEEVHANSGGLIPNGGTINYFGGFLPYMLSVKFNDCQSPAVATWAQKPLLTASTPRVFGDPIIYVDRYTGRTLVAQLEGLTPAGSTTDYTDDDGDTFFPTEGSGLPSCVDHQTLGGGPFVPPLESALYPNAVYYASQCVSNATISLSLDGGITFLPPSNMWNAVDCQGLHGHIKVAPDGTVYVPNKACGNTIPLINGGEVAVVVSEDNGLTWNIRTVSGERAEGDFDPSVGIATDGSIYLGWQNYDGHPKIAVSHNKGVDWTNAVDVGVEHGLQNIAFPAVVAGDGGETTGRAAFAFYGTTKLGAYDAPNFMGVWYLYVSTTFDGGATWKTVNVTPGDPIQRFGICGDGDCRNLLDFFDADVDKEGRILVGWDDGCIGGCLVVAENSFTAKATITRQSGGKRLFADFDPVEPRIPEAPGVSGYRGVTDMRLTWTIPDNGGATITSYNVYRSVDPGPYVLIATVNEPRFDDPIVPEEVAYRVTAVNSEGEGPWCDPSEDGPTPTPCRLPGIIAINDVFGNGADDDSGQNVPPDPSVNVRQLFLAEPYVAPGVDEVTFTLQVAPSTGSVPPSSQWYIVWNRKDIAFDGSDRRFVAMKSDESAALSFVYGDFGPPIPLDGSPPSPNANTPLPIGDADAGSYNAGTGVITIRLAASSLDETSLGANDALEGLNVRTYFARPDGGQRSQNNANDITSDGMYTRVGNDACFVNTAPVARLEADPRTGDAPLLVTFDGSTSSDADAGDSVVSYTFNFGDGSDPVTQPGSLIQHTYSSPSSPSGFFATLTVMDSYGTRSLNVASVNIEVNSSVAVDPSGGGSLPFAFAPKSTPSHGNVFFTLAIDQEQAVTVRLYDAAGRLVVNVLDRVMDRGTHTLHWRGLDASGKPVGTGVYFARVDAGRNVALERVVMVR